MEPPFHFHFIERKAKGINLRQYMEIISLTHHCLLIRFNTRKYLLGLTYTLAQDSAASRLKPDYIVLPSLPYNSSQGLFLWHFPALKGLNCTSLLVSDLSTRKRVEGLLVEVDELSGVAYKWELLKQHDLVEEQLWKVHEEFLIKNIPKPLRIEPHGLAFNEAADRLNIIVPELGRSLLLLHEGKVIIVDPGENILGTLHYYGIPQSALTAILLTSAHSLNFFQLLNLPQRLTIITTEHLYSQVKKQVKNYFFWQEGMLRKKISGNILSEVGKMYRLGNLELAFSEDKSKEVVYVDVVFGMKRMRIRPQRLMAYPQELVELKDLEILVVYDMVDPIKKELESAPAAYRKRILFNRPTRKLNNKYFCTLTDPAHFLTLQAHPYAKPNPHPFQLSFLFRERDDNYRLNHLRLFHGQRFNAAERTVYLREGYLRDQQGNIFSSPVTITGSKELFGQGNALIMHQPERNVNFYSGAARMHPPMLMIGEDLLKKVKENSFVMSLSRHLNGQSSVKEEKEGGEDVEAGSEWDVLNTLCTLKTFQSGSEVGRGGSLLLIVKGGVRWRSGEATAGRGMGICNLRRFYSSAYQQGDEMEAVKDSWAIEISLKDLHTRFFSNFPSRMYELFSKNTIFQ